MEEEEDQRPAQDHFTGKTSFRPPGWQSARQLARSYQGGHGLIRERLIVFRRDLLNDLIAAGYAREQAEAIIDAQLLTFQMTTPKGGRPAFIASPDAVAAAEESGILQRHPSTSLNHAAENELQPARTNVDHGQEISKLLSTIRNSLIKKFESSGIPVEQCRQLVDQHLIREEPQPTGQMWTVGPELLALVEALRALPSSRKKVNAPNTTNKGPSL